MQELTLTVIIPTCGQSKSLHKLLASLAKQKFDQPHEILLVENESGNINQKKLSKYKRPKLSILTAGAKGANLARNHGINHSSGRIILLLDDDCELPSTHYFEDVIKAHNERPDICAIGGIYLDPPRLDAMAKAYQSIAVHWVRNARGKNGEQLQLLGGCVSYKRERLLAHNIEFNSAIQFGGTESDFHERLRIAGESLALDDRLSNIHHCQMSALSLIRKAFLQGQGHTRRARHRELISTFTFSSQNRPKGFWVDVYDLGFVSGKYWASGQNDYQFPSFSEIFGKTLSESPSFINAKWQKFWSKPKQRLIDFYWRNYKNTTDTYWRLYSQRLKFQGKVKRFYRHLLWQPRATWARLKGRAVDLRWRAVNFRNDLKFAYLGYGNHRVFEKFKLNISPPPAYFKANQVIRLNPSQLKSLSESELLTFKEQGQSLLLNCGVEAFSLEDLEAFSAYQALFYGIILSLDSDFDFRLVLPIWEPLSLPVFVEAKSTQEDLDMIYDHLKNIYYMGMIKKPKSLFSSCMLVEEERLSSSFTRTQTQLSESPKFSFVIPLYNNFDYICRVLDHIEGQSWPRESWEIIVIDDGSEPSSEPLMNQWLRNKDLLNFTLIRWERKLSDGQIDKSFRAGRARNLGVEFARGEQLVFLDSDILISPDFLKGLSELSAQYQVIQLTRQMVKSEPSQSATYNELSASDLYRESNYWESFKRAEVWSDLQNFWKYTCTYCLVVSREDFIRVGNFKRAFNTYGFEDVDIGYRLATLGRRFHLWKIPAYHLFPVPTEHSHHFNLERRKTSLLQSCRHFFLLNLDPDIYRDLYTILKPPTTLIFRVTRALGQLTKPTRGLAKIRYLLSPNSAKSSGV